MGHGVRSLSIFNNICCPASPPSPYHRPHIGFSGAGGKYKPNRLGGLSISPEGWGRELGGGYGGVWGCRWGGKWWAGVSMIRIGWEGVGISRIGEWGRERLLQQN